jgi:hypothetical protein
MSALQQMMASFGNSAPFSPSDISGLKLWLKADALALSDNDPVASWTDSSGQGNHATQSSGGAKPTFKTNIVNSKPIIRFDGTTDFLNLPNFCSGFTAGDGFILLKRVTDPPTVGQGGFWQFGTSGNATHVPYIDGNIYDDFGATSRSAAGNPTPSLTSWTLYEVASGASEWTARVNNSILYTTATNTVGFATAPALGWDARLSVFYEGDLAELIMYDSIVSGGNRTSIVGYINSKYGTSF